MVYDIIHSYKYVKDIRYHYNNLDTKSYYKIIFNNDEEIYIESTPSATGDIDRENINKVIKNFVIKQRTKKINKIMKWKE